MGGRITVESVVRCSWNGWPDDRGIRMPEYSDETLLDVRSDSEFHEGHIDGALNLSADEFDSRIEDLLPDKQAPVVCYCRGGNRGALAADKLQQLGYTKVSSIEGGLSAFLSEGPAASG
ncbi:rhodanese-like domain-containing protein [Ectopseudomonas guguanensis]|nr:rhodanese-like domain-containing protein [Pseudomonas guguanensis]